MAGGDPDYEFAVQPDTTEPFGPVTKENLDIILLVFDFSCWLENPDDQTSEPIGVASWPVIGINPSLPSGSWQVDYPPGSTPAPPTSDDYPLTVQSVELTDDATEISVRLAAGTPGMTYVVSVFASAAATKRRKQVDCLLSIERSINPSLVAEIPPPTSIPGPPTVIGGDTTLPVGFDGRVYIEAAGPVTLTLPATPNVYQRVAPVDINGTAGTYPITVAGAAGDLIYTSPTFVMDIAHDDLIFEFDGDHWIVLASRYGFLG